MSKIDYVLGGSSQLVSIYKPFGPFGRGITLLRGPTNHGYKPLTNWDDPPSSEMVRNCVVNQTSKCTGRLQQHTLGCTPQAITRSPMMKGFPLLRACW